MEKYHPPRYYEVDPISSQEWQSLEHTQCSDMKDDVPLCFTPNGLIGLLLEPFFLVIIYNIQ